ncbi:MAG: S8 family peptidase, partial [Chloroflexi bacterium]|nr:S8 family peptidase [Chloroflexota bacterium]
MNNGKHDESTKGTAFDSIRETRGSLTLRTKTQRRPVLLAGPPVLALAAMGPGRIAGANGPAGGAGGKVPLDPTLRVHPYLQYGAHSEPGRRVRVIVQKVSRGASSQAIAQAAGAPVLEEFPFVKSLVLEVPLQAMDALGRNPNVHYVSYDAPVQPHAISEAALKTTYTRTVRASSVWNSATLPATGRGVTVAVIDTGVNTDHPDLAGNYLLSVVVNPTTNGVLDDYGHGTHLIGMITGRDLLGRYLGVAPQARVVSVKIADKKGMARCADLLRGLQWVYNQRATYGIRVVNLSLSSATAESYTTSPVAAAVEQLWLNGVAVVAAAGNRGTAADACWYPPGNDPFVITVGALDDNLTATLADNTLCAFSGRGPTQDGYAKPDVVAPGRRIVSTLASPTATLALESPDRIVDGNYLRLSGTSMAAPVVAGTIALLLERYPGLTPDQLKWLLMTTGARYTGQPDKANLIDAVAAMKQAGGRLGTANRGVVPNSGIDPTTGTVLWGQAYWDQAYW